MGQNKKEKDKKKNYFNLSKKNYLLTLLEEFRERPVTGVHH